MASLYHGVSVIVSGLVFLHTLRSSLLRVAVLVFLPSAVLLAQSAPLAPEPVPQTVAQTPVAPSQQASPAQQPSAPSTADSSQQLNQEEHQRLLGVVPAFNVVLNGSAPPLTPGQKFHLFFKSAVDPAQFGIVALDAGIEQAQGEYPSYHFGFKGYARRYGAAYADDFDGNFFGNAVLPALLHQDPRYFRLGHGTIAHRLGYSLASTVRCKGDDGHWQFSTSNIAGNLIGGAISNAYYPAVDRGFGLTVERGFTVTAEGAIGSLVVEFYPDAIAWLKRHHRGQSQP